VLQTHHFLRLNFRFSFQGLPALLAVGSFMKYPDFLRVLQRLGVQFFWELFCDSRSQASQINSTVTFCWS